MFKAAPASKEIGRVGPLGDTVRYNPLDPAVSASLNEPVRFYAQFRTDHDKREMVSGTMERIHDGKRFRPCPSSFPTTHKAPLFSPLTCRGNRVTRKYLGKNTSQS
jgi:hypothetical protein